jgi:DNA-binding transcriptional LysR family regulator
MRFDVVDLRLFVAVAACGNLTRAAEGFPIALAAASARIKALEESLGVLLLDRNSRGVTLNAAGELFLSHALAILKETSLLRDDLAQLGQHARGTIRLLANTNAINEFLPSLLAGFLSMNPQIDVQMHEQTSQDIVQGVDSGAADLGIIAGRVSTRGLEVYRFREDRLVAVVHENHRLATDKPVRFYQLLDYDFIGLGDRASVQIWLTKQALVLGQAMRMRIQVGSFDAICRMVESGVGLSVIPESSARRLQKNARICIVHIDEDWAERDLKIVVRQLATLQPFARRLFDHLLPLPSAVAGNAGETTAG